MQKKFRAFTREQPRRLPTEKTFYGDLSQLPQHQIEEGAPYSYLAEDGIIDYNGVIFVCDEDKNRICLGDVSDRDQCINVPLADGGSGGEQRLCRQSDEGDRHVFTGR